MGVSGRRGRPLTFDSPLELPKHTKEARVDRFSWIDYTAAKERESEDGTGSRRQIAVRLE